MCKTARRVVIPEPRPTAWVGVNVRRCGLKGRDTARARFPIRGLAPAAKVYGVQPAGADGIVRSLAAGVPTPPEKVQTVADGITAPKPGVRNFEIIRRWATGVFTVPDEAILASMGLIVRHLKVIVEPAGATALSGVLADDRFRGQRVGILLSGSNTGWSECARAQHKREIHMIRPALAFALSTTVLVAGCVTPPSTPESHHGLPGDHAD